MQEGNSLVILVDHRKYHIEDVYKQEGNSSFKELRLGLPQGVPGCGMWTK